ncbi:MAG: P-II family nitrogen regulator, partial [Candidatus Binatia bacterium]
MVIDQQTIKLVRYDFARNDTAYAVLKGSELFQPDKHTEKRCHMKMVEAIVKPFKLDEVKEALTKAG